MIKQFCTQIATHLMASNPWLKDFTVLCRGYHGAIRTGSFTDDHNYSVDDRRGNHAYIRYTDPGKDVVFSTPAKPITPRSREASADMTLILICRVDDPESICWSVASQIAQCALTGTTSTIRLISCDADRGDILQKEIGGDSENWKAIRVRFSITWNANFNICPPEELTTMDRCCPTKIDLGCVNSCEEIETTFTHAAGKLILEYLFEGSSRKIELEHPGGKITIPTIGLNEAYVYTIRVFEEDGTPIEFTEGVVTTNCLEMKITASV